MAIPVLLDCDPGHDDAFATMLAAAGLRRALGAGQPVRVTPLARLPRRTARIRLTAVYGALFLLFGGVLVAMTYGLFEAATAYRAPSIPKVPNAPAVDSHQFVVNSGIALGVVAVLALLAAWLVAGRMLRPIRTITRTARRISSASLHERLALDGPPDELKELGDTLDSLFARLEAAFEAQRHFVANASHELRTPLTAERALLQVALDDPRMTTAAWRSTAREVLASSDEQARLIEALLTLASSEGGLTGREPVDLSAIVAATVVALRPETERLGIDLDAVTKPAPLDADPLLVERLVANLLTNAVRHNVANGRVDVVTGMAEGQAVLSVTNSGPLIPPADVDRLFQPFQRLDRRRATYKDGHGLGLSIVRAIATAHDAVITAHPRPGGGLCVSVIFAPRAAGIARCRPGAGPESSRGPKSR